MIQVIDLDTNTIVISKIHDTDSFRISDSQSLCNRFNINFITELGHFKHFNYWITLDKLKEEDIEYVDEPSLGILLDLYKDEDIKKPFILFHSDGVIYNYV